MRLLLAEFADKLLSTARNLANLVHIGSIVKVSRLIVKVGSQVGRNVNCGEPIHYKDSSQEALTGSIQESFTKRRRGQVAKAADCKSAITGSNPVGAS